MLVKLRQGAVINITYVIYVEKFKTKGEDTFYVEIKFANTTNISELSWNGFDENGANRFIDQIWNDIKTQRIAPEYVVKMEPLNTIFGGFSHKRTEEPKDIMIRQEDAE